MPATPSTLDLICQRRTAFRSFAELINDTAPSYRPSLEVSDPELLQLAEAYDAIMERRGDARRAYRYGTPAAPAPIVPRSGTTIIGGFHVTLRFSTDPATKETVSECYVSRGRESSSLALVENMGGIDGDTKFIEIRERTIARIVDWALARGY